MIEDLFFFTTPTGTIMNRPMIRLLIIEALILLQQKRTNH